MKWLCLLLLFHLAVGLNAQEGTIRKTTEKTSHKPDTDARDYSDGEKQILTLVVTDPSKALAGNRCFEEFITSLGIRYELAEKNKGRYGNGMSRFFHNMGVRFRNTFRHGPFWGLQVRKKRRECREKLHDYMGQAVRKKDLFLP